MKKRRIDDLFEYLNLLAKLRDGEGGYICTREVRECTDEIRYELNIVDKRGEGDYVNEKR